MKIIYRSDLFTRTLKGKKEARKRNLEFHILPSVALSPYLRLVKLDGSYISLVDIHDDYCKKRGFGREDPILLFQERIRSYTSSKQEEAKDKEPEVLKNEFLQVRLDAKNEVEAKYIPRTVISNVRL
jgi:transformation/transcription domain-associated protein